MRRFALVLAFLVPSLALAQSNQTPRFGAPYSNSDPVNRAFDKFDSKAPKFLAATATLDFASAAANTCSADLTVTVTGAVANDPCDVSPPNAAVNTGSSFTCWVSAANTVSVRHCNTSAGANDPASGTYKVLVLQ